MSRRYDPQHIFNHKRTANQQKGQVQRVKLLDEAPERVDQDIIEKSYQLAKEYGRVPIPQVLNIPVEGVVTLNQDTLLGAGSTLSAVCPVSIPKFYGLLISDQIEIQGGGEEYGTSFDVFQVDTLNRKVRVIAGMNLNRTNTNYSAKLKVFDNNDELVYSTNGWNASKVTIYFSLYDINDYKGGYSTSTNTYLQFQTINLNSERLDQLKSFLIYGDVNQLGSVAVRVTFYYYEINY